MWKAKLSLAFLLSASICSAASGQTQKEVLATTNPISYTSAPGRTERTTSANCQKSLAIHVYNPQRLITKAPCVTLTGVIVDASHGKNKDGCRHEADGDGHCWLKLDPGQERFINDENRKNQDGNLVFEPMCRYRVTQKDALAACKGWKQPLVLPPIGSHVKITGVWVLDHQHGHLELHPASSIEVIP